MTTKAKDLVSAPTRRERQRATTHDEIVTVARQLLGSPDALSLRAIAAEMGLTAPALYRYVDSYHELLMLGRASHLRGRHLGHDQGPRPAR